MFSRRTIMFSWRINCDFLRNTGISSEYFRNFAIKIAMNMKKLIYIFALVLALGACQKKSQQTAAVVSDADSIYTYDFIN